MNVVTTNPIVYDSGLIDGDYENAYGKRAVNRREEQANAYGRRAVNRRGRTGGRRRTGLNRAIGVIPVVAGARYLQRRREEIDSQKQSKPSQSERQSRPPLTQAGKQQGRQSKPSSGSKRPSKTGRPAGKPNIPINQQNIAQAPMLAPTFDNKDNSGKNKNIALIIGGVLLLGIGAYLYTKRNK